ncbi:MAG: nicotinate-nucleotide--dimethylbenzimidazole phosphoribosyltransferase [Alkalicoccus sp.]|nr:MAG: nicotinate-nucleotide--dimethylbenzimidazole phosphoribosyltransferase [Alkalicoccus sp.]
MGSWRISAAKIQPRSNKAEADMETHLNNLTKPAGSLGRLEELAVKLAGMQGTPDVSHPAVLVFAGDHGVTEEGVSLYGQELTSLMVKNFVQGGAAINVLAKEIGASVTVTDIGVKGGPPAGAVSRKVKNGTGNIAVEAAMSVREAEKALNIGADTAAEAIEEGAKLIIPGDMGIGNTTVSSALIAAWTGADVNDMSGNGTGVTGAQLRLKQDVIRRAVGRISCTEPLDILAELGGLEHAAMAGAMIEAAGRKTPVLVDGFIASAAALAAEKLAPLSKEYFIFGHRSAEAGHGLALEMMGGEPLLDLQMRLGEGTGAAAAYPLVSMAAAVVREMAVFSDLGIDA